MWEGIDPTWPRWLIVARNPDRSLALGLCEHALTRVGARWAVRRRRRGTLPVTWEVVDNHQHPEYQPGQRQRRTFRDFLDQATAE